MAPLTQDVPLETPMVAGVFSPSQLQLTAPGSDGLPVSVAAASDLRLSGAAIQKPDGQSVAQFMDAAWWNEAQPSPCMRIEGPISLIWSSGEQVYAEPRVFPSLDLVGLSLWGPQRTLIATYTRRSGCWIDSNGNDWRTLVLKARE